MRETLTALRDQMAREGLDAYVVFSEDAHQSEYVAPYWRARAFVSGFTGSAGTLVALKDKAALWTDGRYFLQGAAQLEGSGIDLMKSGEKDVPTWPDYIFNALPAGAKVGFDGRTLSVARADEVKSKWRAKNFKLVVDKDLVDRIWLDRPSLPMDPIEDYPVCYAGEDRKLRIERLRTHMREIGTDAYLVSSLESCAWLLNYRGNDVAYTPVAYAYVLVTMDNIFLFIEESKVPESFRTLCESMKIMVLSYHQLKIVLAELSGITLTFDPNALSVQVQDYLGPDVIQKKETDIIKYWRAVKNKKEQENFYKAHVKDGVAMVRFLKWLKSRDLKNKDYHENDVSAKLASLRLAQENCDDLSFETISGYGSNGAIIHYNPETGNNAKLEPKGFLVLDCGGQYKEGTTDITRTIALGKLTRKQKKYYTLVLKGHIALARAIFPEKTPGQRLDIMARQYLWAEGLDYKHGTGHGVGMMLSVHEGPQSISQFPNNVGFEAGMIITDEPGYYEAGEFGIRIENMLLTKNYKETEWGKFLCFDTLTLCPYEMDAILDYMLTDDEKEWINAYNKRVYSTLAPHLSKDEKEFLKEQTRYI